MSIPDQIKKGLMEKLWRAAGELGWEHLSPGAKTVHYDSWARDPEIGGVLERYMDRRHVRAFLKDGVLKRYSAAKKAVPDRPLRVLGLIGGASVAATHIKPHGCTMSDGRVVVWGRALHWKALLMALYERTYERSDLSPHGVVFLNATGRFADVRTRAMVDQAADLLGIERTIWLES